MSSPAGEEASTDLDSQMEAVLDLLTRRANGDATSAQVEAAVSGILTDMGHGPNDNTNDATSTPAPRNRNNPVPGPQIQVDEGNYDDDDDENDDDQDNATKSADQKSASHQDANEEEDEEYEVDDDLDDEEYADLLSQIPLGKDGAKMMTTFGDGPRPDLKAVKAALLGARKTLQLAIMDARAIRRRAKQHYEEARHTFTQRKKVSHTAESVNPDMLFRAMTGNDRLGRQPKCGFDVEQLTWLFPEEMRSYQRWNDMHSEYTKKEEKDEDDESNDAGDAKSKSDAASPSLEKTGSLGGHLQERAANFDARTEKMKSEWYLKKFAKVRQGSFLPKGARHRKTADEIDWDESRKGKRGRRADGTWENMPSISIRFLHWLGFDPPALCPPNEDSTQALAFLGYDMLGKIVEKVRLLCVHD
jgi:hypothetical protein